MMSDISTQSALLRQAADPAVADAIVELIEAGADHELNRINVLDFSRRTRLEEEHVISGFLHASRLAFTHPTDERRMEFVSPLPADLQSVVDDIRARQDPQDDLA